MQLSVCSRARTECGASRRKDSRGAEEEEEEPETRKQEGVQLWRMQDSSTCIIEGQTCICVCKATLEWYL